MQPDTQVPHDRVVARSLEPMLLTIHGACEYLSVSPAELYRLLGRGKIKAVKAGKRTLLTVPSLKAHAASLPAAKIKAPTTRRRKGT